MMEDTYYQLEEALVQGFQTPEEYQAYKELKEHYEEVTGDYSFSKQELTSQLEIALQNHRGEDFEDYEKEEYLVLVQKLEEFDYSLATHYRQLIDQKGESHERFTPYPSNFFSSRRNSHSFMETLSYCKWTFPYWFCQFSYFRGGLWNLSVLY